MSIDEDKARTQIQEILFKEYSLFELTTFGSRGYEHRVKFEDPENGILLFSRDQDEPCACIPLNLVYDGNDILNLGDVIALRNRVDANSYIMGRGSLVGVKGIEGSLVGVKGIEEMLFPMALYSSHRSKTK